MDLYLTLLAVLGAVILLTAWLPMLLKELPLSLPIICVALGAALVWSPFSPIVGANPLENRYATERMTEFVVIVALMGAGLRLDRPFGWRTWRIGLKAALATECSRSPPDRSACTTSWPWLFLYLRASI